MQYHLEMIGYDTILIRFTDADNAQLLPVIYNVNLKLTNAADLNAAVTDIIPSYQTLLVSFNIMKIEPEQLINRIHIHVKQVLSAHLKAVDFPTLPITIAVCYHQSLAPDLELLSQHSKLSISDIIHIHSSTIYSCYAIGFMPNFGYLGNVDERIQMPRHIVPRTQVPAGSVGIADNQTAIYPKDSPGGWQIIGQSPAAVDSLTVGCQVKFEAISLDDFQQYQHLDQAKHLQKANFS
jgi:inhibitor of KinA